VGSPAVGDINGDGLPEIIAYAKPVSPDGDSKSGYLYAWNREGSLVAGWPVSLAGRQGSDWSVPVIADLDHNGTKEVIAVESDGREQSVYVWLGNGILYPGWPQQCRGAWNASLGLTQARAPVVADVDGDGDREIVVAHYHYLNMWHHTGGQAKGWPVVLDTASAVCCLPSSRMVRP
jgi:hypothetical protein